MANLGRRPKPSDARGDILSAARAQFAERGYTATTLRSVADAAAVHPALIHHYFHTKEQLYDEALGLPVDPVEIVTRLVELPRSEFPEALVRHFITTWRNGQAGEVLHAQLRRAFIDDEQLALLRTLSETVVIPLIAEAFDIAELQVAAAVEMLHGLVIGATLIRTHALTDATDDEIVNLVTPSIARCLGL